MAEWVLLSKCIGCGYCCRTAQCAFSTFNFGIHSVCPALCFGKNRYWCGPVLLSPDDVQLKELLAIGGGCSSTLFNSHRRVMEDFEGARAEFERLCPVQKRYWEKEDDGTHKDS